MRVFKSKWFVKFAHKERIDDLSLCKAVKDAEMGRLDADYGGGVIKQRIARPNQGKSGGYRTIILFRRGETAFFVYGFPKSDQANINSLEERTFKELAKSTLALSGEAIAKLVETGAYTEVMCEKQE